jgi:hypothetical protein
MRLAVPDPYCFLCRDLHRIVNLFYREDLLLSSTGYDLGVPAREAASRELRIGICEATNRFRTSGDYRRRLLKLRAEVVSEPSFAHCDMALFHPKGDSREALCQFDHSHHR